MNLAEKETINIILEYFCGDLTHYPEVHFDATKVKGVKELPFGIMYGASAYYHWVTQIPLDKIESSDMFYAIASLNNIQLLPKKLSEHKNDGDRLFMLFQVIDNLLEFKSRES